MFNPLLPLLFSWSLAAEATPPLQVLVSDGLELARVPAPDESIYVTQKRSYTKRGHLEVTPMFTVLVNSRFVQSMGLWASIAYHFREGLALEVIGGYSGKPFTRYSDTTLELARLAEVEPFPTDKVYIEWFAGADIQWAPIYGKLRLIPGVLGDFDIYLLAGMGVVGTQAPCLRNGVYTGEGLQADGRDVQGIRGTCSSDDANTSLRYDMRFAGQFGGGFRIFFTKWFGARIEVRDIIYSILVNRKALAGDEVSTDIRNNFQFVFGLSFLI